MGAYSEQRDLNPRPTAPKAAALAKLRYAPIRRRTITKPRDIRKEKNEAAQKNEEQRIALTFIFVLWKFEKALQELYLLQGQGFLQELFLNPCSYTLEAYSFEFQILLSNPHTL